MGDENPNAQVEANLLEGKNRYASAGTTLQDIKNDLDSTAAGLQSSWLGGASQDYQDKRGQLTTTVQSASDVLQKGSISIGKMYDSYIEADEKQKEQKEAQETLELFMGVFMLVTALLGLIGPILEAADLLFAAEIEALDIVVEVGDVGIDVAADVGIEEVDTLSNLDNLSDIAPIEENPVPVDNPPEIPPQDAPVDPPQDAPAEPPQDAPVDPPQDAPADPPQDAPADPPQDTPVEDPQTDEAPPNVDQPSEEPTPEPSKHDSGIDLSQDQQDLLDKILNGPTVSETPKEIAPPEPIQVNTVFGGPSEAPKSFEPFQPGGEPPEPPLPSSEGDAGSPQVTDGSIDLSTNSEIDVPESDDDPIHSSDWDSEVPDEDFSPPPEQPEEPDVTVGDDGTITKTTTTQEPDGGTTTVTETTAPNQTHTSVSETKNAKGAITSQNTTIVFEDGSIIKIERIRNPDNSVTTVTTSTDSDGVATQNTTHNPLEEAYKPLAEESDHQGSMLPAPMVADPPSIPPDPWSPAPSPEAGPSQPPKRPFGEGPDTSPDQSDPKGKKTKF